MLITTLTFFGVPILAAFANEYVSRWYWRCGRTYTIRLTLCALATCIGYETVAFSLPFHALWIEALLVAMGTLAVSLIFICVDVVKSKRQVPSTQPGCLQALLYIPFLPMVVVTTGGRVSQAQRVAVELIGPVSQKYRSDNHNAPSLSVTAQDGSAHTLEGVEQSTWDQVVQGSSVLNKPAWSAFGDLDGKRVRVVRRGKIGFATLPD